MSVRLTVSISDGGPVELQRLRQYGIMRLCTTPHGFSRNSEHPPPHWSNTPQTQQFAVYNRTQLRSTERAD